MKSNITTAGEIKSGYRKYLLLFFSERILIIIFKLLLLWISMILFYTLINRFWGSRNVVGIMVFWAINLVFAITRILRNFPVSAFLSLEASANFREVASSNFGKESFEGENYNTKANAVNLHIIKVILYNMLPAHLFIDILASVIQLLKAFYCYRRYTNFLVILTKNKQEGIMGTQIHQEILDLGYRMSEIICKQRLNEMISYDWAIKGPKGYKISTSMWRKLDKNNPDAELFWVSKKQNDIKFKENDSINEALIVKARQENHEELERLREAEKLRLTEKFFNITEKVD